MLFLLLVGEKIKSVTELVLEKVRRQQQQHQNQDEEEEKHTITILIRFDVLKWGGIVFGVNDILEIE